MIILVFLERDEGVMNGVLREAETKLASVV